ncbi:replication/maintenance protein RepL [Streptomyces sp. NPDC047968]|uniref:replication/maintenance protein RepL n=1 Tax=unclassified Streptomyces TaxID=2593676 RepID=UPI00343E9B95
MAEPARRRAPAAPAVPRQAPNSPVLRPADEATTNDLARLVAERVGRLSAPPRDVEVHAVVRRRRAHDMLGTEGYSLISNYFMRRVLPYCLMHKILSPLQTAVLSNMIGRQERGVISATQAEIAEEIGVGRQSVGPAVTKLCELNLLNRPKRMVYELNPRVAFNGNGDQQRDFLEGLRSMKLASRFPDQLGGAMALFNLDGQ